MSPVAVSSLALGVYGRLVGRWQDELTEGFKECLRVLRPFGTLVFKWNEEDVALDTVLRLAPQDPLFGRMGRIARVHSYAR